MKKNILILVGEVLSLHSLKPLINRFQAHPEINTIVINDGFCTDEVIKQKIDFSLVNEPFNENVIPFLKDCCLIISGKSYKQQSELTLLKYSKQFNIPYFMILPDIGGEIVLAKLENLISNEFMLPDKIFIADQNSHSFLISSGIPDEIIVPAGSPYFDEFYNLIEKQILLPKENLLVYISTPFEYDFERGILEADYSQKRLIREIHMASKELGVNFVAKRHPQLNEDLFQGMEQHDGDIVPLLIKAQVVVGSYSTGLIQGAIAGKPAVSYQPWTTNIREDIFSGIIPIAKNYSELIENLQTAFATSHSSIRKITYNPGKSASFIQNFVYSELEISA